MKNAKTTIQSFNEWGKLREVFIGITDDMVEPEYIKALQWMPKKDIKIMKEFSGKRSIDVLPKKMKILKKQVNELVKVLQDHGIKVNRNIPLRYKEEKKFLNDVQKGCHLTGGADFFRVIGNNVILLNNLRLPCRRKQIYSVRPVLEKILKNSNARYVAAPPASPHYNENDIFLEGGDIMIDDYNVYVGKSGNASNDAGIDWLQQFLGSQYKVYTIKLSPHVLHIDCVCALTREGLLTYCPDVVLGELPKPLRSWKKIETRPEETFGANGLTLNKNTIVTAVQYERVNNELHKNGMNVIPLPLDMCIAYGMGARCLTGVITRDE